LAEEEASRGEVEAIKKKLEVVNKASEEKVTTLQAELSKKDLELNDVKKSYQNLKKRIDAFKEHD